ncbi:class I SAM-dependent methyltransferase [Lutimaribacter sp. EGI FJ00015]|uniref:Class I SAM-dependent methyltransferase n=1 Tax=Lutimaribacter degradans TaxID=2945989 RepID=A0ACC5ZW94_9RHOB|nr:class I SAM-dependent methyltransferase [Lutimaribacter sp. EGI FJ00013]MCM2562609.1 class I SAM-dependent methyltransferase [Lutimaribacter sp. EGI FJ00013]MCO0613766.1 class I SAM-dependent methyltransferase [Lutimaribacter sp. EGI FJ00015]MCO0636751.1 class I SAM-dependent methyltransferase [Lutimaribacter sp. EGI FJ00014]
MSRDDETLRVYDARAAEYARVTHTDTPGPLLAAFITALPPGARVLDLGCGPGVDAGHMAAAGLVVEALDASAAMVAQARKRHGVAARQADFDDFVAEGHDGAYHGIWANFSLLHAPEASLPAYLAAIHDALRPGGQFHIAVKSGTGSRRDELGRIYTYYTPDGLATLLSNTGLKPLAHAAGREPGLDGKPADWIAIRATRA